MKNSFDLRKYLTENKLTTNSSLNEVTVKAGDRVLYKGIEVEIIAKTEEEGMVKVKSPSMVVSIDDLKTISGEKITQVDAPIETPEKDSSDADQLKYETVDEVKDVMRVVLSNKIDNLREGIFQDRENLLDAITDYEGGTVDEDAFEEAFKSFDFFDELANI